MLSKLDRLNLQPSEKSILEKKYKSLPFGKIAEEEIRITASSLLIEISLITGWALLEDTTAAMVLKKHFELKLKESYPNVNEHEMLYAFRQNTTVKDWGKSMNLSLIDEVMIPYLENRFEVSKLEESLNFPQIQPPDPEIMSNDEFIELNKNIYLKTKNFALVSERCFAILLNQHKMEKPAGQERERILRTARAWFFKEEDRYMTHEERERMINIFSKKIAVCEYFNQIQ